MGKWGRVSLVEKKFMFPKNRAIWEWQVCKPSSPSKVA